MSFFLLILLGIPILSGLWFLWAIRTNPLRQAARPVKIAFFASVVLLVVGFVWIFLARGGHLGSEPPAWLQAAVLLWGLLFLPFVALPTLVIGGLWQSGARLRRHLRSRHGAVAEAVDTDRRRFLKTTAVALPVIATYGATAISIPQTRHFRVRRIEVPLAGLPKDLDGMTIAHVSDVHVGKFTHGRLLHDLADATNAMKADLVALTGDLIDHALADLPEALAMVGRMDPRSGLVLIEGNHDLFEGREAFARGVEGAGFPLLRNAAAPLEVRGHPVDLLGIRWEHSEEAMARDILETATRRRDEAFPILLAHHPHAFDVAAQAGIPLTLGGHTHGGQLMLSPEVGVGPMMYRYWSGLYRKPTGQATVISNGAGNWFPLRTAAPAEILHLTLRRV
ncbi:metallophosphoesterase [Haloferula sargassicola]|uniref:Calcineurin-like phosphoesterase domain-containing protein n=1 Tax=Haloferula sargassicola TaxID=490096 RepID=A0ABP9ULW6_9BACT